jgi:shikimate dehydrogenase
MASSLRGAVIGSPVEHSLSPLLHREAFKFLRIEGRYEPVSYTHLRAHETN